MCGCVGRYILRLIDSLLRKGTGVENARNHADAARGKRLYATTFDELQKPMSERVAMAKAC